MPETRIVYAEELEELIVFQQVIFGQWSTLESIDLTQVARLQQLPVPPVLAQLIDSLNASPQEYFLFEYVNVGSWQPFSWQAFWRKLEKLSVNDFLATFFDCDHLAEAQTDAERLAILEKHQEEVNYLVYHYLSSHRQEFISLLKSVQESLSLLLLDFPLKKDEVLVAQWQDYLSRELAQTDPLTLSEQLMGKHFVNRGPYQQFVFILSKYLPRRAFRIFQNGRQQLLFLNVESIQVDWVTVFKALGDPTRWLIINQLAKGERYRAVDLAKGLALTPATISHHLDTLKKSGIIHEEPQGRGKSYTLNENLFSELVTTLKTFGQKSS